MTDLKSSKDESLLGLAVAMLKDDVAEETAAIAEWEREFPRLPTWGPEHKAMKRIAAKRALIARIESSQVETTPHAALINEIFERHNRCSKLLWGPAALPGMMLGPEDADAAHRDRGRLLSLLPTQVKTGTEQK